MLPAALVQIAQRRGQGIEALLEPTVEALARFFTQIADEVRRHDRLNVGAQASTPRAQVQALIGEVDVDVLVNEFA